MRGIVFGQGGPHLRYFGHDVRDRARPVLVLLVEGSLGQLNVQHAADDDRGDEDREYREQDP